MRQSQGLGAGRGPNCNGGKGDLGPRGQAGRGVAARGDEQGVGRGTGSGAPPSPDVRPVWCIPPISNRCWRTTPTTTNTTTPTAIN